MTVDSTLSVVKEATFKNGQLAENQVKEVILDFSQNFEIEKLLIGMETTSLHSFHPSMFFKEDSELNQLNLMVSVKKPSKIQKRHDSFYIADYFHVQKQVNSTVKEEKYTALQQLVRTKQHFIENIYYKCNTLSKELRA